YANPAEYGWEVPGDYNTLVGRAPWIEGPWVTKHNGKYYLQYAGPGTEFKSYADAVYLSEFPLGPFMLQKHNPAMYKPEGFAAGAGHGSSFADAYGNFWHIGTMTISQKHMFERRLGMFPVFLDEDGTYYTITKYGDYPYIVPAGKIHSFENVFSGWMLLTYNKPVVVSSSVDSLPVCNMTDEDIRTYWAAASGDAGEYAIVDMGDFFDVYALQVNFAEHNALIRGSQKGACQRFTVEYSLDGNTWEMLEDRSDNNTDNSHVYMQLEEKVLCRYLKISNIEVSGGHFALSGFRAFGKGAGPLPGRITRFLAQRNLLDKRSVTLSWSKADHATGYNISYGTERNKLYLNHMVYSDTTLVINSLNSNLDYYFTIESFNENGITPNQQIVKDFE
ncbi:MAG TPA: discoidin domain-containing protein, partial [Bacteroidales bacterium]|nr:discoidin domain-containing protein [Bacteroidales bacterium]